MNLPDIWVHNETKFRSTLIQTKTKADGLKYIYRCLEYFIDAGCNEDQIDTIERIMKNILKDWTQVHFFGSDLKDSEKKSDDVGKDIRKIKYFESDKIYFFKCTGKDSHTLKEKLVKYEANLLQRRKGGEKSYPKKFIDLTCVDII
jgi:hypothetical protein